MARGRLLFDVLRSEGWRAVRDRGIDRWREARRSREFLEVSPTELARRLDPMPTVLHVSPSPPLPRLGGFETQLLARIEEEAAGAIFPLLFPDREGYALEVWAPGGRYRVHLGGPALTREPSLRQPAFEGAIQKAAKLLGTGWLHFESPTGLPLGSMLELGRVARGFILSVHDFGLFCARPHLLARPELRFCDYCEDLARCAACLAWDWARDRGFQERWRAAARELLVAAAAVVFPSPFLRDRYRDLFDAPRLDRAHVAPPPSVFTAPGQRIAEDRLAPRHVAFVGAIQIHKGALVFEEVVREWKARGASDLRWSALGGGDRTLLTRLRELGVVEVRGYYRAGTLPGLLRRERVDLALLLSIVPESYSLVLEECLAAGVPVLAFDSGAAADRIRSHGGGVLLPLAEGSSGVLGAIDDLRAAAGRWRDLRESARARSGGEVTSRRGIYAQLDLASRS